MYCGEKALFNCCQCYHLATVTTKLTWFSSYVLFYKSTMASNFYCLATVVR